MTKWKTCVCLMLVACPGVANATEDKPTVRVYTNEDLDRIRPFRDESGVASVPAFRPDERPGGSPAGGDTTGPKARGRGADLHSEAYWRAQAERVRERLRKLEDQAAELRRRIAAARPKSEPSGRRREAPDTSAWQSRLAALGDRRREIEGDLLDRARREGALPGWLR